MERLTGSREAATKAKGERTMNERINDGGPAFPGGFQPPDSEGHFPTQAGMTLRDWFAGQALAGYTAIEDERRCPAEICEKGEAAIQAWIASLYRGDARVCFHYADAMLAARNEPTTKGEQQ